ncbi:MAG: hypothetical protein J7539_04520 [Niabella sp.]|nr:hypothetical protein [Niabella sp.]
MNNQKFNLDKMGLVSMTETEMQDLDGGGLGGLMTLLTGVGQGVADTANGILGSADQATGLVTALNGIVFH